MLTKFAVRAILATAVTLASAGSSAQDPTVLRMASTIPWTVPPFQSYGVAQCDNDGNLYFAVSHSNNPSAVVMKVSHDSSMRELYTLPSNPDVLTNYAEFSVTHSGKLRVIVVTYTKAGETADPKVNPYAGGEESVYMYVYGTEPGNPSKIRLDLPDHLVRMSFAAFESGATLATGYFDKHAGQELQGKNYTAVLQSSGKLVADCRRYQEAT
jgi:hypothetical protein